LKEVSYAPEDCNYLIFGICEIILQFKITVYFLMYFKMFEVVFSAAVTPVFSVTGFLRNYFNHSDLDFSRNIENSCAA